MSPVAMLKHAPCQGQRTCPLDSTPEITAYDMLDPAIFSSSSRGDIKAFPSKKRNVISPGSICLKSHSFVHFQEIVAITENINQ